MTNNNITELTPFRVDLTRALAHRGERLLAAVDLADEVAALEPLEAYYVVREIGLDKALPILLQLSQEQLEVCVDLDCWARYDFSVSSLDEWLVAFAQAGPDTLARSFLSLDYVVQLLFLAQTVIVYDPDTDQVPPGDEEKDKIRAMTPDAFYLLELKMEMELKIHPFTVLDALYQYDSVAAHQLLSQVRVDLLIQIEEEALRFRNGRMEDIGFATPDEAAALFSPPGHMGKGHILSRSRKPIDSTLTRVPSVYAGSLIENTLLQQAMSLVTDQDFLARLEQEIVWAINGAIIAYGEKTRDIGLVMDIAERVRDTISLGLESLLTKQEADSLQDDVVAVKALELLESWCVADLFRHGFAATQELQKEVRRALREPRFRAWYDLPDTQHSDELEDRLERAFVTALLGRHPLLSGFDHVKVEKAKAFTCLVDVDVAHARLQRLVARLCGN